MIKFALMVAGLLAVGHTSAQVTVLGASTCGQWSANRNADQLATAELRSGALGVERLVEIGISQRLRAIDRRWLVGFLSGVASGMNEDFLVSTDAESVVQWVDTYCQANPLRNTAYAGSMLVIEFRRDARKSQPR